VSRNDLKISDCSCYLRKEAKLTQKLEWGKYVSPLSDKNSSPFNWYAFKHRFGSELAAKIFSMFGVSKGQTVFDPFCGGGTTLIKAKLNGYKSVGIDISPFSVFLTNTLLRTYNPSKLRKEIGKISHKIDPNVKIPDVTILKKAFSESSLKYIYSLRTAIESLAAPEKDFFFLSLLSILNSVSKAKKSGGFLRITDQRKVSPYTVKRMFLQATHEFIKELETFKYPKSSARAYLGDARNYPDIVRKNKYDAILTSPPYPNRHDYTRIYELELLVGFINNNQSLKSLRYETLRSHVEAKKKYESNGYVPPLLLQKNIEELRKRELNNPQIISTLYGYFEDMYLCLKEMATVLKPNKYVGLVVSNVRFAGVVICVDELLSEIGEQAGLSAKEIYVLRHRGNSSQQMKRYKRTPIRESLVVWKS
jgi:DNA modification methylase